MGKKDLFATSDLPLVAVLRMEKGLKLEGIGRLDGNKLTFHFTPREKAEEVSKKFYRKELKVEPMDYFQTIKSIKSLIYSELNRFNG